jgi:hypothetical protein
MSSYSNQYFAFVDLGWFTIFFRGWTVDMPFGLPTVFWLQRGTSGLALPCIRQWYLSLKVKVWNGVQA